MERIRGGIRKMIGNPDIQDSSKSDIPEIDFGVTQRLTPDNSRPGTAAGRKSPFEALGRPTTASGRQSPFDSLGQPSGRRSPFDTLTPDSMSQAPEKSLTPSPTERRARPSRPQSYMWQPGTSVDRQSPQGLSAEDFVHQRAVLAMRAQGYVPHRTASSGRIEQIRNEQPSPTSPRRSSHRMSTPRHSSTGSLDYSSHLSAREQEHVARMTGGPLLSLKPQSQTPDPSVGLIGAIEARQQERRNIKDGLQGKMVQAAINQRQREARTYHIQYQQQNAYAPQPVFQHPGYGLQQYQQSYVSNPAYQLPMPTYHQQVAAQPQPVPQDQIQNPSQYPSPLQTQQQAERQSGYYASRRGPTSSRWA